MEVARFDRRLYEMKLVEPSLRMQSETQAGWRRVRAEQQKLGQGKGVGFYVKLVDSALSALREYLKEVDRICREVWQAQGGTVTPELVRTVLRDYAVFTAIAARCGAIRGEIDRMAKRTDVSHTALTPVLHHLVREKRHLESILSNRYEIEARELELRAREGAATLAEVPPLPKAKTNSDRFDLPDGFLSAGDPIEGNPFPMDDPRYKVWQGTTLNAEEELCRLNSEFLRTKPTGQEGFAKWMEQNKWASAPEDFAAWALALCLGKFNIWAKRAIHVVWSEDALRSYDQWLFNYAQAWLEAQRGLGRLTDGALLELRSRLAERVEWWKAEARRYLAEQKADLAHASHENAPTEADAAGSKSTDRRALVNGYIDEVFRATGKRITRKMIWRSAGYKSRTEFERWERRDAKRPNNAAHDNFIRILNEKPHLK